MGLYPEILFHFTNRKRLYSILNSTFRVSYARERISGGAATKGFAAPMISFCDLRLSELRDHISTYGKFGIGLTKEWAFNNGLNPVMYVSHKGSFTENYMNALNEIYRLVEPLGNLKCEQAYIDLMDMLRYTKNYKGTLYRPKKKPKPNHVFANEREWRYVAPHSNDYPSYVPIMQILTPQQKKKFNKKVEHIHLKFQPNDIRYLIVEKDDDIEPLIAHLKIAKVHFPPNMVDKLSSRILTFEQISTDI